MILRSHLVPTLCAAVFAACAEVDVEPVCADVALDACDATAGCATRMAYGPWTDPFTGYACWDTTVEVAVACAPDFADDGRCVGERTLAQAPDATTCFWFQDLCTPEEWGTCEDPPAERTCPSCDRDTLPYRAEDALWTGPRQFGRALAIGDVTGDGTDDLVVGTYEGAQILVGPVSDDSTVFSVTSDDATSRREFDIAIGDVDDDGVDDLVFGVRNWPKPGTTAPEGAVLVAFGPIDDDLALEDIAYRIAAPHPGSETGARVEVADHDGDGADDLLVWVAESNASTRLGGAVAWFEGPLPETAPRVDLGTIWVHGTGGFGAFTVVGDVVGDASPDLIVRRAGDVYVVIDGMTPFANPDTFLDSYKLDGLDDPQGLTMGPGGFWAGDAGEGDGYGKGRIRQWPTPWPAEGGKVPEGDAVLTGSCVNEALGRSMLWWDGDLVAPTGIDLENHGASWYRDGLDAPPVRLGTTDWEVAVVGDVNGDGIDDIVAGDPDRARLRAWYGD